MKDRIYKVALWFGKALLVFSGGFLSLGIIAIFAPISEMVRETYGFIGFAFGMIFVVGSIPSAIALWIVTGRNWLDELLGL